MPETKARTSLTIGIILALLSSLVGVGVGATAGYAGGIIDDLLMRLTELFLIPPRFFLALIISAVFGSSYINLIIIPAVTYWPVTARLIRSE